MRVPNGFQLAVWRLQPHDGARGETSYMTRTLILTKCAEIGKQRSTDIGILRNGTNLQQLCSDPSVAPQGGVGGLVPWRQESTRGAAVRRKSTTPMSYYPG